MTRNNMIKNVGSTEGNGDETKANQRGKKFIEILYLNDKSGFRSLQLVILF